MEGDLRLSTDPRKPAPCQLLVWLPAFGYTIPPCEDVLRSGLSLNRSHLIADELKGSGYTSSLNLITTSEHYNQKVMRGAERDIGSWLAEMAPCISQ